MIAFSTLIFALQPAPALVPPASVPDAAVQREIVVIGRKLAAWKARLVTKHDTKTGLTTTRCTTLRSSRDAQIDAIGCAAMRTCFAQQRPRIQATADRKTPASERRALSKAVYRDVGSCVMAERETLIADLAERRFQARQGSN